MMSVYFSHNLLNSTWYSQLFIYCIFRIIIYLKNVIGFLKQYNVDYKLILIIYYYCQYLFHIFFPLCKGEVYIETRTNKNIFNNDLLIII